MSRQRDEKGRFIKKTPKIETTEDSSSEKKRFITTTVDTFQMDEEEVYKKGWLIVEQCREYERRMEMENKWREIVEEEIFRGPTPEQRREYERRLEAKKKRWEDRINERVEDRGNEE